MSKPTYEETIKRAKTNADCGEHLSPAEVTELVLAFEAQVKQLAAENAWQHETIEAVRGVANKSSGISGWHLNGEIAKWEEILPEIDDIETPTTDAVLASLRAEGLEMLAKQCEGYATNHVYSFTREHALDFAAQLRSQSEQVKGVQS